MNNSGHIFEKAAFLCFCFRKLIGKYTVIIYYYYHQLNIKLDKLKLCICINLKTKNAKIYSGPGGGGGGTPIYGLYRYVPRDRVWFLRFSVLK